jgi:transposase-like protein
VRLRAAPADLRDGDQRESPVVEEALIEMYLAGVSVRRVEDITEALWARGCRPRRCRT